MSSCGSTRLRCRVQSRSRRMPAAMIEHRMIGPMNGPPARTISHMGLDDTDDGGNRHGKRLQANG